MLSDIINTFVIATGYDKVKQRDVILNYVNRSAQDLYNELEADALMREVVLAVPADMQVTMPPFIGDLRGMREYNWANTFSLNEIGVPRYTSDTWKFKWRNWTLKGKIPLANSITNAGPLTFLSSSLDNSNVTINIVGTTALANRITESIIVNATSVTSINSYSDITSISSPTTPRGCDIIVQDATGNTLAILYNNEAKTKYILVDVSTYSWIAAVGDGITSLVETLYKTKFYKLFNDTDEFPADGFDDAIAYRALVLWCQGKEGKETDAMLYNNLAKSVLDSNTTSAERGQSLKIAHAANPVYCVFKKMRSYLNWRKSSWTNS